MSAQYECIRCGEDVFEEGTVQSAGSISFRPKDSKFLTLSPGNVPVAARVCMNCGLITLSANAAGIKALIGKGKSH